MVGEENCNNRSHHLASAIFLHHLCIGVDFLLGSVRKIDGIPCSTIIMK